jgi:hypothetical protein
MTQKQIMKDVIDSLNRQYSWSGWVFYEQKVKGIRHVVRGDNEKQDHHLTFALPMALLQTAIDYWVALEFKVFNPIHKLMGEIK